MSPCVSTGRSLLLVVLITCWLSATVSAADPPRALDLGDGSQWSFREGDPWVQDKDGVIHSFLFDDAKGGYQNQGRLYRQAFYKANALADAVIEFDFHPDYRQNGHGTAGLILRATDAAHYYLIYFPWGGQQMRAKNFWATIAKVDGDGYIHNIKMALVPGVPSETKRWYHAKVEAKGNRIRVWVDGRRALDVVDDTYGSGFIGLAGHGYHAFKNISITGELLPPRRWDDSVQLRKPRVDIPTSPGRAKWDVPVAFDSNNMPSLLVLPNGDVLLAAGYNMLRSKDQGRTWGKPEPVPQKLAGITDYGNTMFCTAKGKLIVQFYRNRKQVDGPLPRIGISESKDNGKTWSDFAWSKVAEGWPENPASLQPYGPLVETSDGTLVRFVMGGVNPPDAEFDDVLTWGAAHCKAYAIRSTDGGESWSAPIEIDRPKTWGKPRGSFAGTLDLTECTGVAIGNTITVLVRPIYSARMWQCWSNDAGATWDAASRAGFSGYAQSTIRTKSGAIVCAHRYPQYSINVSRDDGLNWDQGTLIDCPAWAMGTMIEVEPDVVLCVYMNEPQSLPLASQRIRITPTGITPAD